MLFQKNELTLHKETDKIIITFLLGLFGLLMLLPFIWMISASFKIEADVFNYPIQWIPVRTRIIDNYRDVWMGDVPFGRYYINSLIVTVVSTTLALLIGSLGAYGFARIKFAGRDKLFLLIIMTMIIPEQITLLPRFMYFKWLGIINSLSCLVVNSMFSITAVFFLTQFMANLPKELTDSAKMDGAGHFRIYWNIILPLTTPAIATLAILKFIWTWNDYQNPLIFITNSKLYTIPLAIKKFSDRYGEYYSLIMAAAVSAILPLFIVFTAAQKYIVEGITLGSVKG